MKLQRRQSREAERAALKQLKAREAAAFESFAWPALAVSRLTRVWHVLPGNVVVAQMLDRGELLDPETCGWNYVEGLRLDSNPKLALFWDKEGLNEMGRRLSEGGHYVSFVGGPSYNYVPASRWDSFLEEQRRLLAEEKAKMQHNEQPQSPPSADQPR